MEGQGSIECSNNILFLLRSILSFIHVELPYIYFWRSIGFKKTRKKKKIRKEKIKEEKLVGIKYIKTFQYIPYKLYVT